MPNNSKIPDLKVGQKLLITLKNETEKITGTLDTLKKTNLRLSDVHDFKTNDWVCANQIIHRNDIESIKILNEANQTNGETATTENDETQSLNVSSSNDSHTVKMSLETLDQIYNLLKHFVYINICDQKYFKAVEVIKRQRVIGMNIENVEGGRMSIRASVLSIVTDEQIYIFDLLTLNGIPKELKQILKAQRPVKVVHYSKYITDYLKHNVDVELNNVFDTMLAYMVSTATNEVLTVYEVVENIYNLPKEDNNQPDWSKRPMKDSVKLIAAGNVVYLLEIYHTLTHEYFLAPFLAKADYARKQLSKSPGFQMTVREHGKNEKETFKFHEVLQMASSLETLTMNGDCSYSSASLS